MTTRTSADNGDATMGAGSTHVSGVRQWSMRIQALAAVPPIAVNFSTPLAARRVCSGEPLHLRMRRDHMPNRDEQLPETVGIRS